MGDQLFVAASPSLPAGLGARRWLPRCPGRRSVRHSPTTAPAPPACRRRARGRRPGREPGRRPTEHSHRLATAGLAPDEQVVLRQRQMDHPPFLVDSDRDRAPGVEALGSGHGAGQPSASNGSRRTMDRVTSLVRTGLAVARTSRTPSDAAMTACARTRSSTLVPRRRPNPTRSPLGVGTTWPTIGRRSERMPGRDENVLFRCRRTPARCSTRPSQRRDGGGTTTASTTTMVIALAGRGPDPPRRTRDRGRSVGRGATARPARRSSGGRALDDPARYGRCRLLGGLSCHGVLLSRADDRERMRKTGWAGAEGHPGSGYCPRGALILTKQPTPWWSPGRRWTRSPRPGS